MLTSLASVPNVLRKLLLLAEPPAAPGSVRPRHSRVSGQCNAAFEIDLDRCDEGIAAKKIVDNVMTI
jgi:hypothetical protein